MASFYRNIEVFNIKCNTKLFNSSYLTLFLVFNRPFGLLLLYILLYIYFIFLILSK
jgi:hypothetical protein